MILMEIEKVLGALKGAPASVLLLMMIRQEPLTQEFIRRRTRYGEHAVREALLLLADFGAVNQVGRYTWQLAGQNRQLPLGYQMIEPETGTEAESVEDLPGATDDEPVDKPVDNFADEEIRSRLTRSSSRLSRPGSSSSRYLTTDSPDEHLQPLARVCSSPKTRANFAALEAQGIREPARTRLAALDHVTPELVAYHCATANSTGQAIYRIEHNWPAVAAAQPDDRRKYQDAIDSFFGRNDD